MQRLVYTPKVYVFTKDSYGNINDVSRYVVSGTVNRRINAVSNAQVTLRNPKMLFTSPDANRRVAFTSMDPVTIYLKRLRNRPVRVFTGFLDSAPYLQLYPGVIEIRASCTLKRLLYTYFDPALPYTQSFFMAYGWKPGPNGTWFSENAMTSWKAHAQDDAAQAGQDKKDESIDSSISNLLFATMRYIGRWNPDQIFIEKLPKDIFTRLTYMSQQFEADNEEAWKEMQELFKKIIGEGDYTGPNSGSGDTDVSGIDGEVPEVIYKVGKRMNATEKHLLSAFMTGIVESGMKNLSGGDADSAGWRQERASIYPDPTNVNNSARRYFTECKQLDRGQSAGELSADVQRPAAQYRGRYEGVRAQAETLLRQIAQKVDDGDSSEPSEDDATSGTSSGQEADAQKTVRAAKIGSSDESESTSDSEDTKGDSGGKSIRDKIVEIAKDSITPSPPAYYSQPGAMTDKVVPTGGKGVERSDCSQWARAVYLKAGAPDPGTATGPMLSKGKSTDKPLPGDLLCGSNHVEIYIGGDKTIGHGSDPIDEGSVAYFKGSQPDMHFITYDGLGDEYNGPSEGGSDAGAGGGAGGSSNNDAGAGAAGAFFATLQLPSLFDAAEAVMLSGQKSLLNDKPLMPFIQQLCEASLRQFQSMPDGKFFAFYPDYFGEMNHRPPYWEIDDIEVMDGGINVSDDSLITHYFVVGDTMNPMGNVNIPQYMNAVLTSGVVTVFNAFMSDEMLVKEQTDAADDESEGTPNSTKDKTDKETTKTKAAKENKDEEEDKKGNKFTPPTKENPRGMDVIISRDEAVAFLNRYGARPQTDDMPMIKHAFFEMFLAYQRFMLAWSKQFESTFTFTFMPELFPGGKVGFPDHGLQMYIEEVTHTFDYTSGFTTQAVLSSPSVYGDNVRGLPPNMARAIIEPIAGASSSDKPTPAGLGFGRGWGNFVGGK